LVRHRTGDTAAAAKWWTVDSCDQHAVRGSGSDTRTRL
jgi:hypothetical protein